MAANRYYKKLLKAYLTTDAFEEHLRKHCRSLEETLADVVQDDRHDTIGRFYKTSDEVIDILTKLIEGEHSSVVSFIDSMTALEEGDYVKRVFTIRFSKPIGQAVSLDGARETELACLVLSFKKGETLSRDDARVVSFYPVERPVKFH